MKLLARRAAAYLLDVLLLFVVLGPTGWLIQRALGLTPATGPEIWRTLLVNFSLPAWACFTAFDASSSGATPGKRWLALRVTRDDGARVGLARALARTAVKLLPWELVHVSAFALSKHPGELTLAQIAGLTAANALAVAYLACAAATRGSRSVHDFIAGTIVEPSRKDEPISPSL